MLAPRTSDPAAQADLVRQDLGPNVSAVCLQSNGHEATRRLVRDLTQTGTPVVLIGRDMPDTGRFGHVGWDEGEAGKALARALKESLGERTTFMLLQADQAGDTYAARVTGFAVGLQDYTFLKELHRYDCADDPAKALDILAEQGRRYPNLGAWACIGDWPARARLEDLRRSVPAGTKLALIGATPAVWPLLEEGLCPATVGTDYGRWGYEAVSLSELAFHRAVKPGETRHTECRVVSAAQLDAYKMDWTSWSQGKLSPVRPPAIPEGLVRPH